MNLCLPPLCPLGCICPPLPHSSYFSTLPVGSLSRSFKHTEHSSFCCGMFHAVWSLKRASSSMMSHSLCTHAVMLTVFSLVSMSPHFHHPLCLQARPPTLTLLPDPSSSISSSASCPPCSFMLHLAFPQKKVLPACSNSLGVLSPLIGRARLHTTQSFRVWMTSAHSSRPASSKPSQKEDRRSPRFLNCPSPRTWEKGRSCYRRLSLQLFRR